MQAFDGIGARRLLGLVLICVLLLGCQNKTRLVSKEMTLYSFGAYIPPKLLENFTASTGVKVNLQEYKNNEEMLANLAKNPGAYDVVIPSDYAVDVLAKRNALLPLDLALVPNSKNIDAAFLSPYFDAGGAAGGRGVFQTKGMKYSLPFQWGTTGILYNPNVGTPIKRWADLWRPDLKGRIVVLDDARELIGAALLGLGFPKNSTNTAQLAQAKEKLLTLAPAVFDSATPEEAILSGKAWAGVVFSGNAVLGKRKNPKLEYVFPEEGAGIWFDSMVIPKSSLHPDAAHAFINFVLEPDQSVLLTETYPYSNPNRVALALLEKNNAALYNTYMQSQITNPPFEVMNNAKSIKNIGAASGLYEQIWQAVKETQ